MRIQGAGGENGPWSDTVSATTNTAPSTTDSTLGDAWNVGLGETKHGGINGHFTDADGDKLTYTEEAEYPGILKTFMGTERLEPRRAALWI